MNSGKEPIRLLLVEDDELSREILLLQMTSQGHLVETFESGDAALQHIEQTPNALPDAVLTDLQMPGITGPELARQLRLRFPTILLLAMSASRFTHDDEFAAFDGFLLKPFTMEQLAAVLSGRVNRSSDNSAPGNQSSLDEAVYLRLAGSMPFSQLHQLYMLCLSDAETRVGRMRQAAVAGDDSTYRKEAHTIKGGCSMVGASELHTLASRAENTGLDTANHVVSLDEMLIACERLRRILVAREKRATL